MYVDVWVCVGACIRRVCVCRCVGVCVGEEGVCM